MNLAAASTPTPSKTTTPAPRRKELIPFNTPGLTLLEEHALICQLNDTNFLLAQLVPLMREPSPEGYFKVQRVIAENEALIKVLRPRLPVR